MISTVEALEGDHAVLTKLLQDRRETPPDFSALGLRESVALDSWNLYLVFLAESVKTLDSLAEHLKPAE